MLFRVLVITMVVMITMTKADDYDYEPVDQCASFYDTNEVVNHFVMTWPLKIREDWSFTLGIQRFDYPSLSLSTGLAYKVKLGYNQVRYSEQLFLSRVDCWLKYKT